MSFSSDMGRERGGQGGLSMSGSMPLISQLESTFQTGRRLIYFSFLCSAAAACSHARFCRDDGSSESGSISA